jgi:plastin-3
MRAYTLSVLSQLANTGNPIIEKEIVQWVNKKLASAGKTTSIKSFQDSSISNAKVVIDLVDAIKEGSVNYDNVKDGDDDEVSFIAF